ncbi:MAG: BamA/TamA family outer membrane protein [Fibrobacter sp.]|nr:BamA/TamA family outer membrane protein [Fibrobacter sp.]
MFSTLLWSAEVKYEINILGNKDFSTVFLQEQLGIPPEFNVIEASRREVIIRMARSNLERFYLSKGYFSSRITTDFTAKADKFWEYNFNVYEGEKYKYNSVSIELPDDAEKLINESTLRTAQKRPFDFEMITLDMNTIRKAYLQKGYLHVRMDHFETVDRANKEVNVSFSVRPGHSVRMGNFHFDIKRVAWQNKTGLTDTSWLKSLWEINPGEVVDGSYLQDFRHKLLSTQIFSRISIEDQLRSDGSGISDLKFSAVERVPGNATVGAYFEENDLFGAYIDLRHRNLFNRFHEGSGRLVLAQNRQELALGYAHPIVFGTAIRWIPTAIRLDNQFIISHENSPLLEIRDSIEERFEITNRSVVSFGINKYLQSRTLAEVAYADKDNKGSIRFKLENSFPFTLIDNPFEPTKGIRTIPSLGIGLASTGPAKDLKFTKPYPYLQIKNSLYYPIFGPFYAALAYDYGRFFSKAGEDDARTFFQGGSRSVRGYRFRSIYPSIPHPEEADEIIPGSTPQYHRASGEIRMDFPWRKLRNWQIVQYLDWARVSDAEERFGSKQDMAMGTGLRYKWKVITFRVDYSWKKDFSHWNIEPFNFNRLTIDLSQAI